ncbi:DUF2059 domain-containing protein [Kordiimonas sp. SCSIO 12610]|uniref:DUF2059 domain-containing protein n=1 Tax=Kordiimonas sp. SCSIO 12610 TaxID=2829597 RepID=UPI00210D6643|nr:DUF2059 domain-containing protein [Kordiimonas sp. SCSIO 12610]UTW55175.1 DUF2059 domain-containing protein [Kordiimonas sp. SCSIO 12610]
MNRIYISLLLLVISTFPLFPQTAEVDEKALTLAEEVVEVTNAGDVVRRIIPIMLEQQKRVFLSKGSADITDEKRNEINLTLKYLNEELESIYPAFKVEVAKLYANKFSVTDLQAILDFYTSDVGQRYSSGSIELSQEIGALGQKWMAKEALDAAKRARARAVEDISE